MSTSPQSVPFKISQDDRLKNNLCDQLSSPRFQKATHLGSLTKDPPLCSHHRKDLLSKIRVHGSISSPNFSTTHLKTFQYQSGATFCCCQIYKCRFCSKKPCKSSFSKWTYDDILWRRGTCL